MSRYGFTWRAWRAAKAEARRALIDRARIQSTISYQELASRITAIAVEPWSTALHVLLGEISTEEDAAGRGLLSAIVVHKDGDKMPGPGFFNLAADLGRATSDRLKYWIREVEFVFRIWRR